MLPSYCAAGLLDTLASLLGRSYLSDLRLQQFHSQLVCALLTIQPETFPLVQWNEAIQYLLPGEPIQADSCRQARSFLIDHLLPDQ